MGSAGSDRPARPRRAPPRPSPPSAVPTTADLTADGLSNADGFRDDDGFASFEVGAGLPTAAGSRPFLRSVLADDPADGTEEEEEDDAVRELAVRDRFARLDAGLPPLPGGDGPDEVLAPVRRRSVRVEPGAQAPAVGAAEGTESVERSDDARPELALRAQADDGDTGTADPALFAPMVEPTAEPEPAPEPPRVAAAPAAPKRRGIFRAFSG